MMKHNLSRKTVSITIAFLSLLLLSVALAFARGAVLSMPQAQETPAVVDPQVRKLDVLLQRTGLSDETRQNLEEKRIMAQRMALESIDPLAQEPSRRGEKKAPPLEQPLVVEPAEPLWEGIFAGSEGLVRPSTARINNGWQGSRAGAEYQVFAGSAPGDVEQGLLLVAQLENDLPTARRDTYLAPQGTGSLTILEVHDTLLLLESETGHRLYFDLITRQFQPVDIE